MSWATLTINLGQYRPKKHNSVWVINRDIDFVIVSITIKTYAYSQATVTGKLFITDVGIRTCKCAVVFCILHNVFTQHSKLMLDSHNRSTRLLSLYLDLQALQITGRLLGRVGFHFGRVEHAPC